MQMTRSFQSMRTALCTLCDGKTFRLRTRIIDQTDRIGYGNMSIFRYWGCPGFQAYSQSRRSYRASSLSSSTSTATESRICNLDSTRAVLRLGGADLISFLQGLLTNDVTSLARENSNPVYAALLNAQGRHLHDMFLTRLEGKETVLLADVDKQALPDLKRKLLMYRLRSAVDIADVSDEQRVWVQYGQQAENTGKWHPDPRLSSLGFRAVLPRDESPPGASSSSEGSEEFQRWRYQLGVAEGDIEMPSGAAMPLEYNLDALNGVSYSKGCYVGQELIARTHNRGVVRKRLMPVTIEGHPPEIGASLETTSGGSEAGKLRAVCGEVGLAYLRLKPGLLALSQNQPLQAGESQIKPSRPDWWPIEWGNEEE